MLLHEIGEFSADLLNKPRIIGLTKIDSVENPMSLNPIKKKLEQFGEKVHLVSSVSREGLPELLNQLALEVGSIREDQFKTGSQEEVSS